MRKLPPQPGTDEGETMLHLIVFYRWVRLTTRRYGFQALFTSYRPKRAGTGRGTRNNPLGRAHGSYGEFGIAAMHLVAQLRVERSLGIV